MPHCAAVAVRALLLLLGVARVAHCSGRQTQNVGFGSPACPCLNPWPKPPANKTCRMVTFNRQSHHAVNDARTECVPLDYGASKCKAWDKDTSFTTVCKGASTPGSGNYYFKRPARICIILGRIRHHFLLPRRTACSY